MRMLILALAAFAAVASAQSTGKISLSVTNFQLQKGAKQVVEFRLQEPIICPDMVNFECAVVVSFVNPRKDKVALDTCQVKWKWDEWTQSRFLTVAAVENYVDDLPVQTVIATMAVVSRSEYYVNFNPADITVQTAPRPSGSCAGTGDPHYTTFDGAYWHIYFAGTYVFYKVKETVRDFEAQTRSRIWSNGVAVHCGFAVREDKDVVVINFCTGNLYQSRTCSTPGCHAGGFPKVSISGSTYYVTLASGAVVRGDWYGYMNMYATAPGLDRYSTVGVCGNFNGNAGDDVPIYVAHNPGQVWSQHLPTYDLFTWVPTATGAVAPIALNPDCPYVEPTFIRPVLTQTDAEDITSLLKSAADQPSTSSTSAAFVATTTVAPPTAAQIERYTLTCNTVMKETTVYKSCLEALPNFDISVYVDGCIDDLKLTNGDVGFIQDAIGAMEAGCITTASRDTSTWETDNNGNPIGVNPILLNNLCPNQCSNHGTCADVACTCETGYTGVDCSINQNAPPTLKQITDPTCDSQGLKVCNREITIVGANIYKSDNLACKFGSTVTNAYFLGSQQMLCEVPNVVQKGATPLVVPVSVTTDGVNWSNTLSFTFYDSICLVCDGTSCSPNPVSCNIGGVCYLQGQSSNTNICLKCVPSASYTQFSYSYSSPADCGPIFPLSTYNARLIQSGVAGASLIQMNAMNPLVLGDAKNNVTYSITADALFAINPSTGLITLTKDVTVSALSSTFNNAIGVFATDAYGNRAATVVFVELIKTNTNPLFEKSSYTLSVNENSPLGTVVGNITATDNDNSNWGDLTYDWFTQESGYANVFLVNATTGIITVNGPLDWDSKTSYLMALRVKDGGGQYFTAGVTININKVAEAPTNIFLSKNVILEGSPIGTIVGALNASDANDGPFTFTLVSAAGFNLDSKNNIVSTRLFDFETSEPTYEIAVKATTPEGLSLVKTLTIVIGDVNEAPFGLTLDQQSFPESATVGSALATVTAKDTDANQLYYCNLVSGPTGQFAMTNNRLILSKPLDYLAVKSYNLQIACVDNGSPAMMSAPVTFTVYTLVSPAPAHVAFVGAAVPENATVGTVVGKVTGTDENANSTTVSFSIGGDNPSFAIDPTSVKCVKNTDLSTTCTANVILTQPLSYATNPTMTVPVIATTAGGSTSVTNVVVQIGHIDKPPTGLVWLNGHNSIQEHSPAGTPVGQVQAIDSDTLQKFYYTILQGADMFETTLDARRRRGLTTTGINTATVSLRDGVILDSQKTPVINIVIRVTDILIPEFTIDVATTINVTPEPMMVWIGSSGVTSSSVPENTPVGASISPVVVSGMYRTDLTISYSLTADSDPHASIQGTNLVVAERLDFETLPKFFVNVIATFALKDPASNAIVPAPVTNKVVVSVTNVDEAPVFATGPFRAVLRKDDSGVVTVTPALVASDPDGQAVTYSLGLFSPVGLFRIDPNTGVLRVNLTAASFGLVRGNVRVPVVATSAALFSSSTPMTTTVMVTIQIVDNCFGNPCNGNGVCQDSFKSFVCACNPGFSGADCSMGSPILISGASTSNSLGSSSIVGVVIGCIVAVLLVLVLVVVVLRRRRQQAYQDKLIGVQMVGAANPTFQAPGSVVSDEPSPYDIVPGVSNPIYDWYRPDMSRQECMDTLMDQGEGAFVLRDSKATPGWHILGVKAANAVVHEKVRRGDDGMYELVLTGEQTGARQPRFTSLPELVEHYSTPRANIPFTLAFSNPIYDNHQLQGDYSRPAPAPGFARQSIRGLVLQLDPEAPPLPLKERNRAADALLSQSGAVDEMFTNAAGRRVTDA